METKTRTTIELPQDLIVEIKSITSSKTLKGALIQACKEMIQRAKIEKIRSLRGKMNLDVDLETARHGRNY